MKRERQTQSQISSSSSTSRFPFVEETPKGVFIKVKVQPRASKNAIEGVHADALKVRLTAPPVEGEANSALIEFLSKILRIKKSSLSIESGQKSREKRVKVEGMGKEGVEGVFTKVLP